MEGERGGEKERRRRMERDIKQKILAEERKEIMRREREKLEEGRDKVRKCKTGPTRCKSEAKRGGD